MLGIGPHSSFNCSDGTVARMGMGTRVALDKKSRTFKAVSSTNVGSFSHQVL